jgi:hypothetical protein
MGLNRLGGSQPVISCTYSCIDIKRFDRYFVNVTAVHAV